MEEWKFLLSIEKLFNKKKKSHLKIGMEFGDDWIREQFAKLNNVYDDIVMEKNRKESYILDRQKENIQRILLWEINFENKGYEFTCKQRYLLALKALNDMNRDVLKVWTLGDLRLFEESYGITRIYRDYEDNFDPKIDYDCHMVLDYGEEPKKDILEEYSARVNHMDEEELQEMYHCELVDDNIEHYEREQARLDEEEAIAEERMEDIMLEEQEAEYEIRRIKHDN